MLLVSKSLPEVARMRDRVGPYVGQLFGPRNCGIENPMRWPWAADNDAFSGFDGPAFAAMLDKIAGKSGCLFVTAPDVVADAVATDALWPFWSTRIANLGLPPAYVLQDGCTAIPADAGAVFVGGSTGFKLGTAAAALVRQAKDRGLWVHMGRVNTLRRLRYAASIGCDSVDGTQWSRWTDTHLPKLHSLPYKQLNMAASIPEGVEVQERDG